MLGLLWILCQVKRSGHLGAYNGTTANNTLRGDLDNRPLVYMWGAGKGWISQGCKFSSAPWARDWIYRVGLQRSTGEGGGVGRSWVYNWRRDVEVEFAFAELCLMRDWRQVASGMQSLSLDQLFSMLCNKTLCIPNNSLKCAKLSHRIVCSVQKKNSLQRARAEERGWHVPTVWVQEFADLWFH